MHPEQVLRAVGFHKGRMIPFVLPIVNMISYDITKPQVSQSWASVILRYIGQWLWVSKI